VISIGDGIARVSGVEGAMLGEMLECPGGLFGRALNVEEDRVGVGCSGCSDMRRRATSSGVTAIVR
jgi:F-type H+-transporting ATPase subunit alpha